MPNNGDGSENGSSPGFELSPLETGRSLFRQELKPALRVSHQADLLSQLLTDYKANLDTAVSDPQLNPDIINAAFHYLQNSDKKTVEPDKAAERAAQRAQSERVIYSWFEENYGHSAHLLSSFIGPNEEAHLSLKSNIAVNFAHWIATRKGLGKVYREEIEKKQSASMEQFLLEYSHAFTDLKRQVEESLKTKEVAEEISSDGIKNEVSAQVAEQDKIIDPVEMSEEIERVVLEAKIKVEVLSLIPELQAFELRDWISQNARESRRGRKIFETPYYAGLLEQLRFISKKKNGVGGTILYGPPGTGKTELIQENNRQQGFKTRVINIHHYTSFEDLIAGKAIQLGLDRSSSAVAMLKTVVDMYDTMSGSDFEKDVNILFSKLQTEGKIDQATSLKTFLKSFTGSEVGDKLDAEEDVNWDEVRGSFVDTQRSRILRASMAPQYHESVEDIVKGEMLLAIQNGERVALDELDKAGPNSLGGILGFLAQSPGESYTYGDTTVTIPQWFRVDATSNSVDLNEYLMDRFSHLSVGLPPVKDQLMIASVRVSDEEGNIKLTSYEQRQLEGFFLYVVPKINNILTEAKMSALSNRSIQELTSYLVNFTSTKRTDRSFEQAVNMLLLQNKIWAAKPEITRNIQAVLDSHNVLINEPVATFSLDQAPKKPILKLEERRAAAMREIEHSPLLRIINGLESINDKITPFKVTVAHLSDEERLSLQSVEARRGQMMLPRRDVINLSTGLRVFVKYEHSNEQVISVNGIVAEDEQSQTLLTKRMGAIEKLAAASPTGETIVYADPRGNKEGEDVKMVKPFATVGNAAVVDVAQNVGSDSTIKIDGAGRNIFVLDPSHQVLYRYDLQKDANVAPISAVGFSISDDGSHFVVETSKGQSFLHSTSKKNPIGYLPGKGWSFIGNKLLVQKDGQEISADVFYVAS